MGLQGGGLTMGLQLPAGIHAGLHPGPPLCVRAGPHGPPPPAGPHGAPPPAGIHWATAPVGSAGGQSTPIRPRWRNTEVRSSRIRCSRSPLSTDVRLSAVILPTLNLASREKTHGCTVPSGMIANTPPAHFPQSSSSVLQVAEPLPRPTPR
jgi:hypothetical protein